jgi:nucleoside-diphosphate-sugar epimerase
MTSGPVLVTGADTTRARAAFGFSPPIPLAEGIAAYAAALRDCEGDQAATGKLFA